jgi:branched-chain amino acid transport system ATP-binding protein
METVKRALVLEAANLSKQFGARPCIKGASLAVSEGEVVVLLGRNGSGKTTLLDMLGGYVRPDGGVVRIHGGRQTDRLSARGGWSGLLREWQRPLAAANGGVRRIWQDCRLFPTLTLQDNLAVAYPHHRGESAWRLTLHPRRARAERDSANARALETLRRFRLDTRKDSLGDTLSLGQEKRLAIRRSADDDGRLLLLDEPLSGLDSSGRTFAIDLIREFVSGHGRAAIVAEHQSLLDHLLPIATTILELEDGVLTPRPPRSSKVRRESADDHELSRRLGNQALDGLNIDQLPLPGGARLVRLRAKGARDPRVALAVEGLMVSRGRRPVLGAAAADPAPAAPAGITFEIAMGEVGVLFAPNGWGKTTLLEAVAGLLPVQNGSIRLHGTPVQTTSPWVRARRGVRLLRARDSLFDNLTAAETLRLFSAPADSPLASSVPETPVRLFSGGERRRLGLATLMRPAGSLTLADEPFSGLDAAALHHAWPILCPKADSAVLLAIPEQSQGDHDETTRDDALSRTCPA